MLARCAASRLLASGMRISSTNAPGVTPKRSLNSREKWGALMHALPRTATRGDATQPTPRRQRSDRPPRTESAAARELALPAGSLVVHYHLGGGCALR